MVMACYECDRLLAECGRLKRVYTSALHARIESMSSSPEAEYIGLRNAAEEAWMDAECAMLEFRQHKRNHGKAN